MPKVKNNAILPDDQKDTDILKVCRKCNIQKMMSDFSPLKNGRYVASYCKECMNLMIKNRYHRNKAYDYKIMVIVQDDKGGCNVLTQNQRTVKKYNAEEAEGAYNIFVSEIHEKDKGLKFLPYEKGYVVLCENFKVLE